MNWFTNRFSQPAQPDKPKEPPVRNEWPEPEDNSNSFENKEEYSTEESSEAGGEHGEGS